jgi:ubiquinone/menaquinone biosynthesis C-methylase UbiE
MLYGMPWDKTMSIYYPKNYFQNYTQKYGCVSEKDLASIIRYLPPIHPDSTILDLACGSGVLGERLKSSNHDITILGADICLPLLKWAVFPTCQSDAGHLPFKDAAFDGIVAAAAFHHFPDIDVVLNECSRCLKPGGFLLAYDPNKFHLQRFLMMTDPLRHVFYRNGDHAISPIAFRKKLTVQGFGAVTISYLAFNGEGRTSLSRLNHKLASLNDGCWPNWLQPLIFPWFVITATKGMAHTH